MERTATVTRKTRETDITLTLTLDAGEKKGLNGSTGIGFFDHMMNSFAIHGDMEIKILMQGDLEVDCHHSVEDFGITLGQAFKKLRDENKAVKRFAGETIPMDESLASVNVDAGGRAYLVFNASFNSSYIGDYDTQMTREFFYSLSSNMSATIHINLLYGENDHHKTEAIFKAAARALNSALELNSSNLILSSKGDI